MVGRNPCIFPLQGAGGKLRVFPLFWDTLFLRGAIGIKKFVIFIKEFFYRHRINIVYTLAADCRAAGETAGTRQKL